MKIDKCIRVKFSSGINSNFDKRFTEQKTVLQTFYNGGRHARSHLSISLQAYADEQRAARSHLFGDQCESACR